MIGGSVKSEERLKLERALESGNVNLLKEALGEKVDFEAPLELELKCFLTQKATSQRVIVSPIIYAAARGHVSIVNLLDEQLRKNICQTTS